MPCTVLVPLVLRETPFCSLNLHYLPNTAPSTFVIHCPSSSKALSSMTVSPHVYHFLTGGPGVGPEAAVCPHSWPCFWGCAQVTPHFCHLHCGGHHPATRTPQSSPSFSCRFYCSFTTKCPGHFTATVRREFLCSFSCPMLIENSQFRFEKTCRCLGPFSP